MIGKIGLLLTLLVLGQAAEAGSKVENVRIWSEDDRTRVVLDLDLCLR